MMREKIQELTDSVKPALNEAYFGPEKKPGQPQAGGSSSRIEGPRPSRKRLPRSALSAKMSLRGRTVLVTGVSGNLGTRLLPLLSDFHVVGVDVRPPVYFRPA